jgi:CHAP domain
MNGQAWCAMFVSWVGAHAGVWMPKINSNRGFAAVVSARSFARKHNLLTTKPRVGSVFLIIGRNGKGHTGLVESINWARRTITTIEGNTNAGGSRNGDGVYRRTRKISSINGGFMLIPTSRRRTKANIANS